MQRLHLPSETYHFVEVGLDAPSHDSLLLYGQQERFSISRRKTTPVSAYTTGRPLLRRGDTAVSFVGIPPDGPTLDSRMDAATEIVQNRMHVVSVAAGGYVDEDPRHTEPFQESLAQWPGQRYRSCDCRRDV